MDITVKTKIFISSAQKELAAERRALKDYIHGDPLLGKFFEVFLFEDVPAKDRRADQLYLEQVDRCSIYVGLFGNDYGREDTDGISPTEREFDRASAKGKVRLIFLKGADDAKRHPKMRGLIKKAGDQLIRRRFVETPDLTADLYASLIEYLEQTGAVRTGPFDAAPCAKATLEDISDEKVKQFLRTARHERNYILAEDTPSHAALTHLNLLDRSQPTHAAVLLFGHDPQRFLPTSEIKCLHFHGTEIRKPIPSYQIYRGTVFDLVDRALGFVLSSIARSVGTREHGPQAPVTYELPKQAVSEAIVNAVAHRDYTSNASVQVMLFADRLEVWNPGELPPSLTPESLRHPHASIPHNPLIADPLFLVRYAEKAGSGTLDMISLCQEAGLPEPEFRQDGGQFVMTLWRDWLTEGTIDKLGLNERQRAAVAHLKTTGRMSNREYRELTGASARTAVRELGQLVAWKILGRMGGSGRAAHYIFLREKRAGNTPNAPVLNAPETRQMRHISREGKTRPLPPKQRAKSPKGSRPSFQSDTRRSR